MIAVAAPAYGDGARHVDSVDAAVTALEDLTDGDAVLVRAAAWLLSNGSHRVARLAATSERRRKQPSPPATTA